MSIRIINKTSGRTIIVKNQDDMNNLDTGVSSVNDSDREITIGPKQTDFSDDKNIFSRLAKKKAAAGADLYNYDNFDDDVSNHYIATTQYSMADEKASWEDPTTVDAPLLKFKNPEDQVKDEVTTDDLGMDGFEAGDDVGMTDETEDEFNLDDPMDAEEPQDDSGMGGEPEEEEETGDFQGLIRTVRGAALVYKRKVQNGTYTELWVYNVGSDLKQETSIRKAIISGTDIDPNTQMSDQGEQKAKTTTIGNVQFLEITGLVQ